MLPTPDYTKFDNHDSIVVETLAFLYHQRFQSIDHNNDACKYRGPNGLKCAVGYWIPDEIYEKSFEGRSLKLLIGEQHIPSNVGLYHFFDKWFNVFYMLQKFHDGIIVNQKISLDDLNIHEILDMTEDEFDSIKEKVRARVEEMDEIEPFVLKADQHIDDTVFA